MSRRKKIKTAIWIGQKQWASPRTLADRLDRTAAQLAREAIELLLTKSRSTARSKCIDIINLFKQRHDLEERAAMAVHTLHKIYVLTPNQTLGIVYANAWSANVCMEYVVDDAREQSLIRYAVFENNSRFVNYDLDQDQIEDRCSMVGTDLTNIAEKELGRE